jgi:hypothetical protein
MNELIETNRAMLIFGAAGLGVLALAISIFLIIKVSRLTKPFRAMADIYGDSGAEKSLEMLLKGVDENRDYIRGQADQIKGILKQLEGCLSGTGMVKYNAFEDIGGNQSYSLCVLNGQKNGFILTNLVGRNSTRGYAIEVKEGVPSRELGEEESEALGYALKSIEA